MAGTYDYVVGGAGTAGCVLANRLSADEDPDVLLLGAGEPDEKEGIHNPTMFPHLMQSEVDWDYLTVPQPGFDGREEYWPRGKGLGGSSSINAMMYVRGNLADYDRWEALGNDGRGATRCSPTSSAWRTSGAASPSITAPAGRSTSSRNTRPARSRTPSSTRPWRSASTGTRT